MSLIGNSGESASFKNVNDTVAGRIVAFEDYQEVEFSDDAAKGIKRGDPKFYPKSGDPVMGVRITLEKTPGDADSRVTLWAHGKLMLTAIREAVKGSGARDLELGADLAVAFTGYSGRAKTYQAQYVRADAE